MTPKERVHSREADFLAGKLLIAMPMMKDRHFSRSVVYMCVHSSEGAMGLVINHHANDLSVAELLDQLGLKGTEQKLAAVRRLEAMLVHVGGPVEKTRGFVLHTTDYANDGSTLKVDAGVALTSTVDVLRALASGKGPAKALLALGYAGWAPGQLESEIQANGWLHCDADEAIVFDSAPAEKYDRALAKLGIDPSFLVSEAGHA